MEVPSLSPNFTGCVTSRHEKGEGSSFFKQNGIRCGIWFKKIYFWQWLELCSREHSGGGVEGTGSSGLKNPR